MTNMLWNKVESSLGVKHQSQARGSEELNHAWGYGVIIEDVLDLRDFHSLIFDDGKWK